jgi:pyruvate formate lyase activating enzyme
MSELGLKEAMFWEPVGEGRVWCHLCPHGCRIAEDHTGLCRVRKNVGHVLRSLNYDRISAAHLDPIEKKPLFHFHPGAWILSLGTVGCNLACTFCQNWQISQAIAPTRAMLPEQAAVMAKGEPSNIGIAYTYNEPFIWYEFVLETAELAKAAGLVNVLVTNGFVEEAPLRRLLPFVDAMNVDIKSMRDDFYRELCRARAAPPRRTVEIAKAEGCHIEVTNLVIPNWNDSDEEIRELIAWVASVDPDLALHFSRYHPDYKMTEPPTPETTLLRARELAQEKLRYVYIGNVRLRGTEDTVCPNCKRTVIERRGFEVTRNDVREGKCAHCGAGMPIVGS